MLPKRLYIENFMCISNAYIDFTQFTTALVIGKIDGNDSYSNGVGKTSLFKAIEYVLFNQADSNLENIVRDDSNSCRIVLDFLIGDQEYRVSRSRTKKGITDLTLLQRNNQDGLEEEVYHKITNDVYLPYIDKKETSKYWKDLSGSRAGDTENDLNKLIKFTSKSFRSTVHFMQNDMSGLSTVSAEKRKNILKEALNLLVYSKLEKLAKEKGNLLYKDIEKHQIMIEGLGSPDKDLEVLSIQLSDVSKWLSSKQEEMVVLDTEHKILSEKIAKLKHNLSILESKFASLLIQEISITNDQSKLSAFITEYTSKRTNTIKIAKGLLEEIKSLEEDKTKLSIIDYHEIDILIEQIDKNKEQITQHNLIIKTNLEKYEDLKLPLPSGSVCKNCRKPMSDSERTTCQEHINQDMIVIQKSIQDSKKIVQTLNIEVAKQQQILNSLKLSKQQLENINTKILNKKNEYESKNLLYKEYASSLEKSKKELEDKNKELETIKLELKNSSVEEANLLKIDIEGELKKSANLLAKINILNKEITHYNSSKAIIRHTIEQKSKDKLNKENLAKSLRDLEVKYAKFPAVIQGFSSTGIPNLIIQDVLDDLQIESNNLLNLLKPGLQLSFLIEKTRVDGEQADTLDIKYYINNKERYYEQLSGAMRLAVSFSLKLGLSFLLQKRMNIDIKFLLLDEIDQSLDKASVDALVDIIKFFQKDFMILVITHNDRLKDRFNNHILVEQDMNGVSHAKVVSIS
jgi:DNA repair exonuclease SbcCD ATPase subunit